MQTEDVDRRRAGRRRPAGRRPGVAQEKLTVWWVKGFYKAEDDALFAAIKKFEAKHPKHQGRAVAVPGRRT